MDTRLAKRNYSIQQWKAIIQDRNNTTHVIKSPLFSDVLSRQTHIHHTGRFYFFQISCSIGMLFPP